MNRHLVIGATGVMGTAAIRALRERAAGPLEIIGVWYGREGDNPTVDGVDRLLRIDLGDDDAIDRIRQAGGDRFGCCFYATALGEVGFPIPEASAAQVAHSNRLSFDPLPRLEAALEIGTLVGYSTFFNLEHQKITYGAMGHSKHAIEQWVTEPGRSRRRCIRAGAFVSASSQGIKLLVRRRAKQLAASTDPLLRRFFADTKPSLAVERLEQAVFDEERARFGDSGTNLDGLIAAHHRLLADDDGRFVNVCGTRVWISNDPLPLT